MFWCSILFLFLEFSSVMLNHCYFLIVFECFVLILHSFFLSLCWGIYENDGVLFIWWHVPSLLVTSVFVPHAPLTKDHNKNGNCLSKLKTRSKYHEESYKRINFLKDLIKERLIKVVNIKGISPSRLFFAYRD